MPSVSYKSLHSSTVPCAAETGYAPLFTSSSLTSGIVTWPMLFPEQYKM